VDVVDYFVRIHKARGVFGCERVLVAGLREGVILGLVPVLHADLGHVHAGGSEGADVFLGHAGLVAGLVASGFEVEVGVRGQGNEFSSLVGGDTGHLLPAEHDRVVLHSGGDREHCRLHCTAAGGAACFDTPAPDGTPADSILDDGAHEQLPLEVVCELGGVDHAVLLLEVVGVVQLQVVVSEHHLHCFQHLLFLHAVGAGLRSQRKASCNCLHVLVETRGSVLSVSQWFSFGEVSANDWVKFKRGL